MKHFLNFKSHSSNEKHWQHSLVNLRLKWSICALKWLICISVSRKAWREESPARTLLLQHQNLHRRLLEADGRQREQRRREIRQVIEIFIKNGPFLAYFLLFAIFSNKQYNFYNKLMRKIKLERHSNLQPYIFYLQMANDLAPYVY